MSAKRRLRIKSKGVEAARLTRECLRDRRLVYVILADHKLVYPKGRSRVAYIGTTRKGVSRVLGSLAVRAQTILKLRGVKACHIKLVTCTSCSGLASWRILERAMLVTFRGMYGAVPRCNKQGKRMKPDGVFDYFRPKRVARVVEDLS